MKCYFCNGEMSWEKDFNYDEVHGEGEGVVSCWICTTCGAEAEFSRKENNDIISMYEDEDI